MMIVLVMVGFAVAASVPPFLSVLRDSRTEAAVNEVALSLRAAHSKAISQGNNFIWKYTADAMTYELTDDDNNNGVADAGEAKFGPVAINGILKVSASTIPSAGVTFFPLGNVSTGGEIDFSDGRNGIIQVRLESATGMVTVSNHESATDESGS
jgi:Tfp pilus assembly protein FimT